MILAETANAGCDLTNKFTPQTTPGVGALSPNTRRELACTPLQFRVGSVDQTGHDSGQVWVARTIRPLRGLHHCHTRSFCNSTTMTRNTLASSAAAGVAPAWRLVLGESDNSLCMRLTYVTASEVTTRLA